MMRKNPAGSSAPVSGSRTGPTGDPRAIEELVNSLTHGIGAALGVAALVLLVVFAGLRGDAWQVVTLSIFGATLVILYLASTLYHGFRRPRVKRFFRLIDHSSIYLLIAGTYTPVCLVLMRGPWGWTLFGLIWGLAVLGIASRILLRGRMKALHVATYIGMGWLVLIALGPTLRMVPPGLLVWLVIGGSSYTLGVVFFLWKRLPYHHAIWHLFVLGGSVCHFFGMLLYVVAAGST
jgi:hemolysin III